MLSKTDLRKYISYIIPPLITVGLCYVLYADIDLSEIAAGLKHCNFLLVASFLACNVGAMIVRGLRWRLQLRGIGMNPSAMTMSRSIFGCYALNMLFPRLGELWRCAFIAKNQGKPFGGVFGSMVADRLADTLSVFLIACLAFTVSASDVRGFLDNTDIGSRLLSLLTSGAGIAAAAVIAAAALFILKSRSAFASKARAFVRRTWSGFTVLFTMPRRGQWLLLTAIIWTFYFTSMYLSMLAFSETAPLVSQYGAKCVLLTFVFGSLAMAIPSNGGIGPWQLAIVMSLSEVYGLGRSEALTFATLNLAASTLLIIMLGIATFLTIALRSRGRQAGR